MLARDSSMSSLFKSYVKEGTEAKKSGNYSSMGSKTGKSNTSLNQNEIKMKLYSHEKENISGYSNYLHMNAVSSPSGHSKQSAKGIRTHMRHPSPQIVISEGHLGDTGYEFASRNEAYAETPKTSFNAMTNSTLILNSKNAGGPIGAFSTQQHQAPHQTPVQVCSSRTCKSRSINNCNSSKPPSRRRIVLEEVLKKINLFKSQYPENQRLLEYLRKKSDMNKLTYYNYLQEPDRNVINGLVQILYDKLETILSSEEEAEKSKSSEKTHQSSANTSKLTCKSGTKFDVDERSHSDASALNYPRYSNIHTILNDFVWLMEELKKEFMAGLEENNLGKPHGKYSGYQPSFVRVRLAPFENLIHEFRKNHEKFTREFSQLNLCSETARNRNIPVEKLLENFKRGVSQIGETSSRATYQSEENFDVQKSLEDYQKIKRQLDNLLKNDNLVKAEEEYYEFTLGKDKTGQLSKNTLHLDETTKDDSRWSLNTTKNARSNRSGFLTDETYRELNSMNLELQASVDELYRELNSLKQSSFQEKLEEESKEKAFKDEINKLQDHVDLLTLELGKKETAIEELRRSELKCLAFEALARKIAAKLDEGHFEAELRGETASCFGEDFLKAIDRLLSRSRQGQENVNQLYDHLRLSLREKISLLRNLRFLFELTKNHKDRDPRHRRVTFDLDLDKETSEKRLREIDNMLLEYQKESQLGQGHKGCLDVDLLESPKAEKVDSAKIEKIMKLQTVLSFDSNDDLEKKTMANTINELRKKIEAMSVENQALRVQQDALSSSAYFETSEKPEFKNFRRINNLSREAVKLEAPSSKKANVMERKTELPPSKPINEDFLKMIFLQAHSIEQLL